MAEFQGVTHLYASVRYQGKSASIYGLESWQVGWRIAMNADNPLPVEAGRIELADWPVQDSFVARDNATFNIEQGFSGVTVSGVTITDADQDAIAQSIYEWCTAIKAFTSANYTVDTIRLYPVGADGKSKTAPSIYTPKVTTGNPTATTMLPPDVAIAISTVTATRGPKGRGRVFMGAPAVTTIDGQGSVTGSVRTSLANATADLFDSWRGRGNALGAMSFSPIVWHREGDKAGIEDGNHGSPIRAVRVDDRCDTQRRRDRQVANNWTVVPLA